MTDNRKKYYLPMAHKIPKQLKNLSVFLIPRLDFKTLYPGLNKCKKFQITKLYLAFIVINSKRYRTIIAKKT